VSAKVDIPRLAWLAPIFLAVVLVYALWSRPPSASPTTDKYPTPEHVRTDLNVLSLRFPGSVIPFHRPGVSFGSSVHVDLGGSRDLCKLSIALRNTGVYRVTLLHKGQTVRSFLLGPSMLPNGLRLYKVDLCGGALARAVDALLIEGVDRRDYYELGPVQAAGVRY